jgi:hypothetical protein
MCERWPDAIWPRVGQSAAQVVRRMEKVEAAGFVGPGWSGQRAPLGRCAVGLGMVWLVRQAPLLAVVSGGGVRAWLAPSAGTLAPWRTRRERRTSPTCCARTAPCAEPSCGPSVRGGR